MKIVDEENFKLQIISDEMLYVTSECFNKMRPKLKIQKQKELFWKLNKKYSSYNN